MRLTQEEYDKIASRFKRTITQFKQATRNEPLAKNEVKEKDSGRVIINITSYRTRLCDPDNVSPKYIVDAMRYEGLIKNDTIQDIDLTVQQVKVKTRKEERTEIEIINR